MTDLYQQVIHAGVMLKSSELVSPVSFPATSRAGLPILVKSEWAIMALLALIAGLPTLALWNRASYLTGDSYQYLRAATTFANGQGLRDMSGNPFTVMTPLYPLLIGIIHRLVPAIDIETICQTGFLCRRHDRRNRSLLATALALLASVFIHRGFVICAVAAAGVERLLGAERRPLSGFGNAGHCSVISSATSFLVQRCAGWVAAWTRLSYAARGQLICCRSDHSVFYQGLAWSKNSAAYSGGIFVSSAAVSCLGLQNDGKPGLRPGAYLVRPISVALRRQSIQGVPARRSAPRWLYGFPPWLRNDSERRRETICVFCAC